MSDSADAPIMDGKYLAQSRLEMLEAVDQSSVVVDHGLRSLSALTEAFTELKDRVLRLETGSHCNICCAHEAFPKPASTAT
jgi:hypothetical protein